MPVCRAACRVVYCVLLISVDRYLIVYNPERSRCLCRPRWVWRYLLTLVMLVILLQVPRLFEVTFTNDDRGIHNITKAPFSLNRFYSIYYAVDLLLHHTVPIMCAALTCHAMPCRIVPPCPSLLFSHPLHATASTSCPATTHDCTPLPAYHLARAASRFPLPNWRRSFRLAPLSPYIVTAYNSTHSSGFLFSDVQSFF